VWFLIIIIVIIIIGCTALCGSWPSRANIASKYYPGQPSKVKKKEMSYGQNILCNNVLSLHSIKNYLEEHNNRKNKFHSSGIY
jgi:cytochrome c biogenesis factor